MCVCVQAYVQEPRELWVQNWPGQMVLCVSQIYWTAHVHAALDGSGPTLLEFWDSLQVSSAVVSSFSGGSGRGKTVGCYVPRPLRLRPSSIGLLVTHKASQSLPQATALLCLRFNGHLPGGPGLAGTGMSPFWILLELRVTEVVSGNNWSYKDVVTTNKPTPSFYRPDARPVAQRTISKH